MPLFNKRAVNTEQREQEAYKEQLLLLKRTAGNLELVSEQFEGAAEGLTESSDKVGHGVQVLAEGATQQEKDVLQCRKVAEEFTAKITDMDQETSSMLRCSRCSGKVIMVVRVWSIWQTRRKN